MIVNTPYPTAIEDRGNGAAALGGIETCPRFSLQEFDGLSGRLHLVAVTAVRGGLVSRLAVGSAGVAAVGGTLARIALFALNTDGSLTMLARTGNSPALGAATYTPYELPMVAGGALAAAVNTAALSRYVLGFLQVAATPMRIQGAFVFDPPVNPCSWYVDGQADIATSYPAASLTVNFTAPYVRARP